MGLLFWLAPRWLIPAEAELVALAPDVIVVNGTSPMQPLLQITRSVPIVFVQVTDPVGAGYVASLARPRSIRDGIGSLSSARA